MEVAFPTSSFECPICTDKHLETPEETPTDAEEPREMPLRLPCRHILGAACITRLARQTNASSCVICILTPECTQKRKPIPCGLQLRSLPSCEGRRSFKTLRQSNGGHKMMPNFAKICRKRTGAKRSSMRSNSGMRLATRICSGSWRTGYVELSLRLLSATFYLPLNSTI